MKYNSTWRNLKVHTGVLFTNSVEPQPLAPTTPHLPYLTINQVLRSNTQNVTRIVH